MKVELMFHNLDQHIKSVLHLQESINQELELLIKLEILETLAEQDYINQELDLEFINLELTQLCINQVLAQELFIKLELQVQLINLEFNLEATVHIKHLAIQLTELELVLPVPQEL